MLELQCVWASTIYESEDNMKKLLRALLSVSILVAAIFMNVMEVDKVQAANVDVWDGGIDDTWYDPTNIQSSYDITSARQLAGLAKLVNSGENFQGVTINLLTDIDLDKIEWTPIGNSNKLTGVTFNGNGYIIHNLKITSASLFMYGFFGWIENTNINNVIIENGEIISSGGEVGMLVADSLHNSNIYQCYTSGTITFASGSSDATGGLVGMMYAEGSGVNISIKESASSVSITSAQAGQYAGLVGWVGVYDNSLFEIMDCYYNGELRISDPSAATNGIGGIIVAINGLGFPMKPSGIYEIKNCYVSGIVENTGDATSALGIALVDGLVDNCYWNSALGIVGVQQMTWDSSLSNFAPGTGQTVNTAEKSLEEMKSNDFLSSLNNGRTTWGLLSNEPTKPYPMLNWQLKAFAADYTLVNQAITNIPTDLSNYTNASVTALNNAVNAVVFGKDASEQILVNSYATAINNAIQQLVYKLADYTKVNVALANVPSNLNLYTQNSVKTLTDAIHAVIQGKNITEQTIVDGYATAIDNAIQQLVYKPADYTKVNEALAKVPSNLNLYTQNSVRTLTDAIHAVIQGKNISEQTIVDDYAKAIETAINNLEKKQTIVDDKDKENEKKDEIKKQAASTGDATNPMQFIMLLVISGGILVLNHKKGKNI